jgi:hypothetical protein
VSVCTQSRSVEDRLARLSLLQAATTKTTAAVTASSSSSSSSLLDRFELAVDGMGDAFLEAYAAW